MTATETFEEARQRAAELGRKRAWGDIAHVWDWQRAWDPPFYARDEDHDDRW